MNAKNKIIFNKLTFLLIIFSFVEILFFDNEQLQFLFAVIEYLFCTFLVVTNFKKGIICFISFTLIAVGLGNFTSTELPSNFWGIRLGGFSFNILYSFFLFFYSLFINKKIKKYKLGIFNEFIILLFFYCIIVGLLNMVFGNNYLDNYFSDFMTYFPFFIYFYLLKQLDYNDYYNVFFSTFIASIFLLLFALIFDRTFLYGNSQYLVQNTVCNIIIITIFIIRKEIGNILFAIIFLFLLFLVSKGLFFLSGKVIISILMYLMILVYSNKTGRIFIIPLIIIFLFQIQFILENLIDYFDGNTIAFKLTQIKVAIELFSIENLSIENTSIGNLALELRTSFVYYLSNPLLLIFGQGFGGGIYDVFGLLKKWTLMAGYAEIDGYRNNYLKMHLPITEMFVKGGVILMSFYLYVLYVIFRNTKSNFKIIFFFMFFLYFYVSKENLLYTMLIFGMISNNKNC